MFSDVVHTTPSRLFWCIWVESLSFLYQKTKMNISFVSRSFFDSVFLCWIQEIPHANLFKYLHFYIHLISIGKIYMINYIKIFRICPYIVSSACFISYTGIGTFRKNGPISLGKGVGLGRFLTKGLIRVCKQKGSDSILP